MVTMTGILRPDSVGQGVTNLAAVTPNGLESDATRGDDVGTATFRARFVDLALEKTRVETEPLVVTRETDLPAARDQRRRRNRDRRPDRGHAARRTRAGDPAGGLHRGGPGGHLRRGRTRPGAEAVFDLTARADPSLLGTTTVRNEATVATDSPDLDPSNDAAGADVPIEAPPDLAIEKTRVETGPLVVGSPTTFRLRVTNNGGTALGIRDCGPAAGGPGAGQPTPELHGHGVRQLRGG